MSFHIASVGRTAARQAHLSNPTLVIARNASTSSTQAPNALRRYLSLGVFVAGGTAFTLYYLDSRSALHRYGVMPLIRSGMDPEAGHKFAVKALASGFAPRDMAKDDEALVVEVCKPRRHCTDCTFMSRTPFFFSSGATSYQARLGLQQGSTRTARPSTVRHFLFDVDVSV